MIYTVGSKSREITTNTVGKVKAVYKKTHIKQQETNNIYHIHKLHLIIWPSWEDIKDYKMMNFSVTTNSQRS